MTTGDVTGGRRERKRSANPSEAVVVLFVRIRPATKQKLFRMAEKNERSTDGEISTLIEQAWAREERARQPK